MREQYSNVTLDFLYGVEDEVVGFTYNGTPYYYRKNLQGDVIGILNQNGEEVAAYTYDAWGKHISITGDTVIASINPIRYRSYYYDTETSLYYLNSRYYDPDTCRFINADDVSIVAYMPMEQLNVFSYCGNNPIENIDLTGNVAYTKNSTINKLIEKIMYWIPNIYTDDLYEKVIFKIGTKNLYFELGVGVSAQSNKAALFGGSFNKKKRSVEISSYFGINDIISLGFTAGVSWRKAYFKTAIMIALPKPYYTGLCAAICLEISIPTWVLLAIGVAVAVISVYAPAVGGYLAKTIACVRKSIKKAAPILVKFLPKIFLAIA